MSINISHISITNISNVDTIFHLFDRIDSAIRISGKVDIEGHTIEEAGSKYKLSSPKTCYRYPGDVYSSDLMFLLGHVAQRISVIVDDHLLINKDDLADNPPSHPGFQDLDIWTEDQMREWIKKSCG